jgi:DNA-binding NarL/FixJ family response regulator
MPPPSERPAKNTTPRKSTRVVVADDHVMTREALAAILQSEPGIEVVGQCGNGLEAVELAGKLQPDVVLMDRYMPVVDGLEATRSIKTLWPAIRIIGHSIMDEKTGRSRMLAAGADEFVSKTSPPENLLAAIRRTARNRQAPARAGGGGKKRQNIAG